MSRPAHAHQFVALDTTLVDALLGINARMLLIRRQAAHGFTQFKRTAVGAPIHDESERNWSCRSVGAYYAHNAIGW